MADGISMGARREVVAAVAERFALAGFGVIGDAPDCGGPYVMRCASFEGAVRTKLKPGHHEDLRAGAVDGRAPPHRAQRTIRETQAAKPASHPALVWLPPRVRPG